MQWAMRVIRNYRQGVNRDRVCDCVIVTCTSLVSKLIIATDANGCMPVCVCCVFVFSLSDLYCSSVTHTHTISV